MTFILTSEDKAKAIALLVEGHPLSLETNFWVVLAREVETLLSPSVASPNWQLSPGFAPGQAWSPVTDTTGKANSPTLFDRQDKWRLRRPSPAEAPLSPPLREGRGLARAHRDNNGRTQA